MRGKRRQKAKHVVVGRYTISLENLILDVPQWTEVALEQRILNTAHTIQTSNKHLVPVGATEHAMSEVIVTTITVAEAEDLRSKVCLLHKGRKDQSTHNRLYRGKCCRKAHKTYRGRALN